MEVKDVKFGADARERMLRGSRNSRRCSTRDAGPKGRKRHRDYAPRSTKDGVTVAKEIELADKLNMGA